MAYYKVGCRWDDEGLEYFNKEEYDSIIEIEKKAIEKLEEDRLL